MRLFARLIPIAAAAVLVAACAGAAASPSPQATTPLVPEPTPVGQTPGPTGVPGVPSADPNVLGYWLRAYTTQALPPLSLFGRIDPVVITGDGTVVTGGPVDAIFPGPLVTPLVGRHLSDAGRADILKQAGDLGLLGRQTDFTGGPPLAGGATAHVSIAIDSKLVDLTGNPDVTCADPCSPAPSTPQAFALFWRRLTDISAWLAGELGPEAPYTPFAYAMLVGPMPQPQSGINPVVMDWPLQDPLATLGVKVGDGTYRCATFTGGAVPVLQAAFAKANSLTAWNQDPQFNAAYGLTVVPLVPGQNPCGEIFGVGK